MNASSKPIQSSYQNETHAGDDSEPVEMAGLLQNYPIEEGDFEPWSWPYQ